MCRLEELQGVTGSYHHNQSLLRLPGHHQHHYRIAGGGPGHGPCMGPENDSTAVNEAAQVPIGTDRVTANPVRHHATLGGN